MFFVAELIKAENVPLEYRAFENTVHTLFHINIRCAKYNSTHAYMAQTTKTMHDNYLIMLTNIVCSLWRIGSRETICFIIVELQY